MSSVIFKNVEEPRIRQIFKNVLDNFPILKPHLIILEKRKLKKTTMRAQPLLIGFFSGKNFQTFLVQFSNATELKDHIAMHEVPEDVLAGWFAHELGHVVDYEGRNALEMLIFGLRYATSRKYRKQVEHRADAYAIDHGMAKLILATKKFILEHSDLSESYKSRIRQYYMSEENVRLRLQEAGFEDIQPDDANILDPDP